MLDLDKMLFNIPPELHTKEQIIEVLKAHSEVKFVSLAGADLGAGTTDEKIPVDLFIKEMDDFLSHGVQTDGSSVILPKIADIHNAKVDIVPDLSVNWYVDYNLSYFDGNGLPIGTLRIPSFLVHNDNNEVGARVILRDAVRSFKDNLRRLIAENPYVLEYLQIDDAGEIEEIELTAATELEFWVRTPDDRADREQLYTAQMMKEQYWKRTVGPVRTALEKALIVLDRYGFQVEMGHKEVGGIKAKLVSTGDYDHVMEQLEIDWKYSDAMQAADNETQVRYIVRDIFRMFGLDVTFLAKPIDGVAGSGEHTHMGVVAKLKNGKIVNLFNPRASKDFLSPIGFGAMMGLLKNYEVVSPFINASNDAMKRLKPGYEAPVSIVTSLGHSVESPSRNRTVLVGLIRDARNPAATRFELRSPCPRSNTYLVIAASYMAMLDGIEAALTNSKTPEDLLESISKKRGEEDFYLEKNREYRSEKNIFDDYTQEEREHLFGEVPATVWETLLALEKYPDKIKALMRDDVMDESTLNAYKQAMLDLWAMELHNRIIPNNMSEVRRCKPLHVEDTWTDLDRLTWHEIKSLRIELGQDSVKEKSLLSRVKEALDTEEYQLASDLQIEMEKKMIKLADLYLAYTKNLL